MSALGSATKKQEAELWIAKVQNNPAILDKCHPEIARFWLEQAGISAVAKPTLEQLLLRAIDVMEQSKSESNEQVRMEQLFESLSNDLASIGKSWADIHQFLNLKMQEVGA